MPDYDVYRKGEKWVGKRGDATRASVSADTQADAYKRTRDGILASATAVERSAFMVLMGRFGTRTRSRLLKIHATRRGNSGGGQRRGRSWPPSHCLRDLNGTLPVHSVNE